MSLGALEAGGTKMVCAIGDENGNIYEQVSIPTETPEVTLPKLAEWFRERNVEALGIGCFGPIDLNKESETYGYITSTPKLPWVNCDVVGYFKKALAAVSLGLLFGLFAGLGLFVVETVTGTSDSADAQAIESTADPQVKETLAEAETSGQDSEMDTEQQKKIRNQICQLVIFLLIQFSHLF